MTDKEFIENVISFYSDYDFVPTKEQAISMMIQERTEKKDAEQRLSRANRAVENLGGNTQY